MSISPDKPSADAIRSRLGFNGEYLEHHGVQILGSYRAYNPALMRFNNPDSLSPFAKGGLNAYAYCQGDPLNFVDPTGHFALASQTRRFLWVITGLGFASAAIAGTGAAGMRKSKSRDAAIAIAGIGLTVGIAAAMPLVFQKFPRTNFRELGRGLLQRMRHHRNETPANSSLSGRSSSSGRSSLPDSPDSPHLSEANISWTHRMPDDIAPTYPIASLIDFDGLPNYLYATDPYFKQSYHQLIEGPPPASSPESIRTTSL